MSVEAAARRVLESLCDGSYGGLGVVVTDSEILRRVPGRRAVTREKEVGRMSEVVERVVARLREGELASAMGIVRSSEFAESIRVTEGYEQLLGAVAGRFRAGDNVWADTLNAEGVIVLRFWNDPTHGRVY